MKNKPNSGNWELRNTNKITGTGYAVFEIIPVNDSGNHVTSMQCKCIPTNRYKEDRMLIIHNAFDGRDIQENNVAGH